MAQSDTPMDRDIGAGLLPSAVESVAMQLGKHAHRTCVLLVGIDPRCASALTPSMNIPKRRLTPRPPDLAVCLLFLEKLPLCGG